MSVSIDKITVDLQTILEKSRSISADGMTATIRDNVLVLTPEVSVTVQNDVLVLRNV